MDLNEEAYISVDKPAMLGSDHDERYWSPEGLYEDAN